MCLHSPHRHVLTRHNVVESGSVCSGAVLAQCCANYAHKELRKLKRARALSRGKAEKHTGTALSSKRKLAVEARQKRRRRAQGHTQLTSARIAAASSSNFARNPALGAWALLSRAGWVSAMLWKTAIPPGPRVSGLQQQQQQHHHQQPPTAHACSVHTGWLSAKSKRLLHPGPRTAQ